MLSTITVGMLYATIKLLFSRGAAYFALILFGFGGASINLGQLAVYDSLAIPMMAISMFLVAKAAVSQKDHWGNGYLFLAGLTFSLSVLIKYIGLLYLPVFGLAAWLFYSRRKHTFSPFVKWFVLPVVLILFGYFLQNRDALIGLFQQQEALLFYSSSRSQILHTIITESGFLVSLAFLGILVMPLPDEANRSIKSGVLFRTSFLALIVLAFIAPVYHFVTENGQSLWKHLVYSSLFWTPWAGYALSYGVFRVRSHQGRRATYYRLAGMLAMIIVLIWYVNDALDRNWGFLHSWPNIEGALTYLDQYGIDNDTRILAEQSAVYEYDYDQGAFDRDVWSNTFYLEYRELQGLEGMQLGIKDKYFDLVILDDYYTSDINTSLRQSLDENNYVLVYKDPEPQQLIAGQPVSIQIFARQ